MKKLSMLGMMVGVALLCAAPISLHWSPAQELRVSLDTAQARTRTAAHADERRGGQPQNASARILRRLWCQLRRLSSSVLCLRPSVLTPVDIIATET